MSVNVENHLTLHNQRVVIKQIVMFIRNFLKKNAKSADSRMANLSVRIQDVQTNMMVHLGMADFVQNFVEGVFAGKKQ